VGDTEAPVKGAPLEGGNKLLVSLHDDRAFGGFGREDSRGGECIGVEIDPRRHGFRAQLADVRVEHDHVEGSPEEFEDRDRKVGNISRRNRKVPVEAVQVSTHSRDGNVGVARVREQLEGH
jgi:hypothetical protein